MLDCMMCHEPNTPEHQALHQIARQWLAIAEFARRSGCFMAFGPVANLELPK